MGYYAVVEDINDPLEIGRVRVRIYGLHTDNTSLIPTEKLKWATVVMPVTSASMSGIGNSPTGLLPGAWVRVEFDDAEQQYPIVTGSVHGYPLALSDGLQSLDDVMFSDFTGNVDKEKAATRGTYTPSTNSDVTIPSSDKPDDLTGMPMVPPSGYVSSSKMAAATANIKIIVQACKDAGITSRRAIASILGIIGGESLWMPVKESFNYSAKRLVEVFPSTFPTLESAQPYANNPTALPEKLYGYDTKKGKMLGNTKPGDGAKYPGMGFVQLTGLSNYTKYAKLSGYDIVSNPELLITNPSISAAVSVAYFKDRVKVSQNSDGYFAAAKSAVGFNTPDIATKKQKLYTYFMTGAAPAQTKQEEQNAVDETPAKDFDIVSANKEVMASNKPGFRDPNGVYPLWVNESDTSRLARNEKIEQTIVQAKKNNRVTGIQSGNVTWEEQVPPYGTVYPNNHVKSTVAHTIELDDTPNSERIHVYHKAGSYIEIDNTGSRTTRIVGSSYEIIDYNGHLLITGTANVTIGGQLNVSILGNANLNIGGDASIAVGGDINAIGQNINLESSGDFNIKASGNVNVDGSTINLNSGASSGSGLTQPENQSGNNIENPVPTAPIDSKAVLFEIDGDADKSESLIKEAIANGDISADEASRQPSEGESAEIAGKNKDGIPANCAQIASMDNYPSNMKLSPNFTLGMVSSNAAVSSATVRDQNGLSSAEIVCNLQYVCLNVLEEVKKRYPNVFVTSGFRYPGDNPKSQHPMGQAVDLQFRGATKSQYYEIAKILATELPIYDQLLLEYAVTTKSPWIHISCNRSGNRRNVMTFFNHKKYKDGLADLA